MIDTSDEWQLHNIAATFRKAFLFEDVAETDWFYSSVRYVFENGLMTEPRRTVRPALAATGPWSSPFSIA